MVTILKNNCNESDGGQIQSEMEQGQFGNSTYNHEVSDDWVVAMKSTADLDTDELSLASLSYPLGSSDMVELSFEVENVGFARPFNPRGVEVVLKQGWDHLRILSPLTRTLVFGKQGNPMK